MGANDVVAIARSATATVNDTIEREAIEAVRQYARMFFGAENEEDGTLALLGLEQNFALRDVARDRDNTVLATLTALQRLQNRTLQALQSRGASSAALPWRLQMYLLRGYFDSFQQARLRWEQSREQAAMQVLSSARSVGTMASIQSAITVLNQSWNASLDATSGECLIRNEPVANTWLQSVYQLIDSLNTTVGASVIQTQDTKLNLNTLMTPLSDAPYLLSKLQWLRGATNMTEEQRLEYIEQDLLRWNVLSGVVASPLSLQSLASSATQYHDDLGSTVEEDHPNLDLGQGTSSDPSYYFSPLIAGDSWGGSGQRQSWNTYAQTFYEYDLSLRYSDLSSSVQYQFTILYYSTPDPMDVSSKSHPIITRLVANDRYVIHDFMEPPSPMKPLTFLIPRNETANGSLTVSCQQPRGLGGNGKTCLISQTWLMLLLQ